ncbi:Lysosome membrane protein 2 [Fragariocoptes setiger]|uniref:Scavenger receptor class B member 1 n=1 Tax=Fragariocoptes setiger TaxID=1670756 RepID=A0ABQ7S978_9ACAR|nr:Lysosome membrane protein 2 [Fragariocoptes setiger]
MLRITSLTLAILLVIISAGCLYIVPGKIQEQIQQEVQLKIATKMYEKFTRVPIPLTMKVTFFNITNPEQVLSGNAMPVFQEVGPFVYKQWRRREVQDFEDNNRKVRYREIKTYYLDEPANRLDLNATMITLVNVPMLAVLTKVSQLQGDMGKSIAAKIVSRLSNDGGEKILITRPATEFLFDGYAVKFFQQVQKLVDGLGYPFDSPLKRNKFGFFYGKNNTWNRKENGEFTIFSGRHDSFDRFMQIDSWNNMTQLNVWPKGGPSGNACNTIQGTDGSQFHPGLKRDTRLYVFSPEVCRSLQLEYREDTTARDIPLYRYSTPTETFAAPYKNEKSSCFCVAGIKPIVSKNQAHGLSGANRSANRCYLDGIMDLSLCQGAPIAVSSPHFFGADPMLAMTAGLRPQKSKHETYVDIEPMTGSVMRASKRAQINAIVDEAALKLIDSSIIGHMTPMISPLFWVEESAEIDEKLAHEFKTKLLDLVQRFNKTMYTLIIVGILIILASLMHFLWSVYWRPSSNDKQKHNADKVSSSSQSSIIAIA